MRKDIFFSFFRNQLDNLVFLNESKNNSMTNETNNFRKIVNCIEKHKRAIRLMFELINLMIYSKSLFVENSDFLF